MYYYGQFASNEVMEKYVAFICSVIPTNGGACVNRSDGFPMKGCYVPVKLKINKLIAGRALDITIKALGFTGQFTFYLSRLKSPAELLRALQLKIDDEVNNIIVVYDLNQDEIWNKYHPLKNLKLKPHADTTGNI